MSGATHSSGPWMVAGPSGPRPDTPEGGDYAIMDGGTNILAEVFYRVSEGPGGTRPARANAHLIAAAPAMFAFLQDLKRLQGEGLDLNRVMAVDFDFASGEGKVFFADEILDLLIAQAAPSQEEVRG